MHRIRKRGQRNELHQLSFEFPATWGGARPGAGRKPGKRANVPHRARPKHRSAEPVHVTLKARLAPLRSQHVFPTVRLALVRAGRRHPDRFRILHYSVQYDHIHLIVEAQDTRALSRGVQSVAIRVARYVNDLLSRRGALWAERWHGRALRTPREVRNALIYVLGNFRKHATRRGSAGIDVYSSGRWFDGWSEHTQRCWRAPPTKSTLAVAVASDGDGLAVTTPRTWLASVGWRRHGLIDLEEAPAAAR